MIRAKFKVISKKEMICGNELGYEVQAGPVYDSNPESENGQFYKYTPSGSITLSIVNAAAAEQFVVGEEYYVDFTPAKK